MVVLKEVSNMFWGLRVESGKQHTQTVERSFHISMAAVEPHSGKGGNKGLVSLMIQHDKAEFVLCTLEYGKFYQQPLDLNFTDGEEVTFFLNGNGIVHLSGFLTDDTEKDSTVNDPAGSKKRKKKEKEKPVKNKTKVVVIEEESDDDSEDDFDDDEDDDDDDLEDDTDDEDDLDSDEDYQDHDDYCTECGGAEDLIFCAECPAAYHAECHDPPLCVLPRGRWVCTICEDGIKRRKSRSRTPKKSPRKQKQAPPKCKTYKEESSESETDSEEVEESSGKEEEEGDGERSSHEEESSSPRKVARTSRQQTSVREATEKNKSGIRSNTASHKETKLQRTSTDANTSIETKSYALRGSPSDLSNAVENGELTKWKKKKNKNTNAGGNTSKQQSQEKQPARQKKLLNGGVLAEDLKVGHGPEVKSGKMVKSAKDGKQLEAIPLLTRKTRSDTRMGHWPTRNENKRKKNSDHSTTTRARSSETRTYSTK